MRANVLESKEYYIVHKRYYAEALAFLGFRYYKYTNEDKITVYSFKNTMQLQKAIDGIMELKSKFN